MCNEIIVQYLNSTLKYSTVKLLNLIFNKSTFGHDHHPQTAFFLAGGRVDFDCHVTHVLQHPNEESGSTCHLPSNRQMVNHTIPFVLNHFNFENDMIHIIHNGVDVDLKN